MERTRSIELDECVCTLDRCIEIGLGQGDNLSADVHHRQRVEAEDERGAAQYGHIVPDQLSQLCPPSVLRQCRLLEAPATEDGDVTFFPKSASNRLTFAT